MSSSRRRAMFKQNHANLNIAQQCRLLGIPRSGVYFTPRGESEQNLALMREIKAVFEDKPFMDVRQMRAWLRLDGHTVGLKRVRRLMRQMHLMAIQRKKEQRLEIDAFAKAFLDAPDSAEFDAES